MEDKLRALHARSFELETQLQVEARGRRSAEEANRELVTGAENARQSMRELQGKVRESEKRTAHCCNSCFGRCSLINGKPTQCRHPQGSVWAPAGEGARRRSCLAME